MAKRLADQAIMQETSSSDFSDLEHYINRDSEDEGRDFDEKKFEFVDEVTADLLNPIHRSLTQTFLRKEANYSFGSTVMRRLTVNLNNKL